MKKSFSLWSRIKRYVIIQYLSGKINPIVLLAIKNGLKFQCKAAHSEMNIYSDSKGNRYINTPLGFSPVEKYNLSIQLRELRADYEISLSENDDLERKLKKTGLQCQKLQEKIEILKLQIAEKIDSEKISEKSKESKLLIIVRQGVTNSFNN